jgi:hypothetical protein
MNNFKNKYLYYLIFLFISSIFIYIYLFSLKNIINLWTYSEVHLNYSSGFVRRGLFGEIILFLSNLGIKSKESFSTIFFIFYLVNAFLFLSILKRLTDNIWLYIFFTFNPAFILFSFYDLGGYARSEVFGIFLILLHSYIYQDISLKKISFKFYYFFYYAILYPFILISFLLHEINIFFIIFHLITTYKIINFYNKINFKINIIFSVPVVLILTIFFWTFSQKISQQMLLDIFNNLADKTNISIWIWEALLTPISERSEFSYMAKPFLNIIYYLVIFIFYLIPILFFLNNLTRNTVNKFILLILSIIPFVFLFFIARDWGRWIHIILIMIFCFYSQYFYKKPINIKLEKTYKIFVIFFFIFQIFFTRIPHCCNLIEKKISLIGGFAGKIVVLNDLINNKINVEERFKKF